MAVAGAWLEIAGKASLLSFGWRCLSNATCYYYVESIAATIIVITHLITIIFVIIILLIGGLR